MQLNNHPHGISVTADVSVDYLFDIFNQRDLRVFKRSIGTRTDQHVVHYRHFPHQRLDIAPLRCYRVRCPFDFSGTFRLILWT